MQTHNQFEQNQTQVLSTSLNHWLEGSHEPSPCKHLHMLVTKFPPSSTSKHTVTPSMALAERWSLELDVWFHWEAGLDLIISTGF